MSVQVNRTIGYMISSFVGLIIYTVYVIGQYQEGAFNQDIIVSTWGTVVLIVIGVVILLSILTAILVTIFEVIRTREEEFVDTDERDRLFELKGDRISHIVSGLGFVLAMITLAVGQPALVMFNIIVFSLLLGGILGYVTRLYHYRRGY